MRQPDSSECTQEISPQGAALVLALSALIGGACSEVHGEVEQVLSHNAHANIPAGSRAHLNQGINVLEKGGLFKGIECEQLRVKFGSPDEPTERWTRSGDTVMRFGSDNTECAVSTNPPRREVVLWIRQRSSGRSDLGVDVFKLGSVSTPLVTGDPGEFLHHLEGSVTGSAPHLVAGK